MSLATSALRQRPSRYWIALAAVFLLLDAGLFRLFAFGADWAPLWAAGKLAWTDPTRVYDFHLVTSLQTALLGPVDNRPFIYPPTALLFVAPFALLPFWPSFALLSTASALLFVWASRAVGTDRALLSIAPPLVLCAIAGQPSLIVGALAVGATTRLGKKDMAAGVLLGLAAAIKPTLFILAPIALLCGGHWRALIAAGMTMMVTVAASLALLGLETWTLWLHALPKFQQLVLDEPTLISSGITPYTAAMRLGVDPRIAIGIGALIAIPTVALVFVRSDNPAERLVALMGGALLAAPYAMNYELALLAPAVLAMPLASPRRLLLPTIWAVSLCSGASLLGLVAVYSWMGLSQCRSFGNYRRVQPGVHVPA